MPQAITVDHIERAKRTCSMCGRGTSRLDSFCSDRCGEAAMEYARNVLRQAGWTEHEITHGKSRQCLYRHFDDDGRLLYVGISLNAIARLSEHRRVSHWFDRITRLEIERHQTREVALTAELEAIRTEKPPHNIAGEVAA